MVAALAQDDCGLLGVPGRRLPAVGHGVAFGGVDTCHQDLQGTVIVTVASHLLDRLDPLDEIHPLHEPLGLSESLLAP